MKKTKFILTTINLILLIVVLGSCEDEVIKNTTRDGLGDNIPINTIGVVLDTSQSQFIGNGLETNYSMRVQLYSPSGESTFSQLLTEHDYQTITIGDTLTSNSSRSWWLKNYGKPQKEGLKQMFLYGLIIIVGFGLMIIIVEKWDQIESILDNTMIGNIYNRISQLIEKTIGGYYGIVFNYSFVTAAVLMVYSVNAILLFNIHQEFPKILNVIVPGSFIIALGMVLMLFNGLKNFARNIRVLALGTNLIGIMLLFFHFVLGLNMEYMFKHILESLSQH